MCLPLSYLSLLYMIYGFVRESEKIVCSDNYKKESFHHCNLSVFIWLMDYWVLMYFVDVGITWIIELKYNILFFSLFSLACVAMLTSSREDQAFSDIYTWFCAKPNTYTSWLEDLLAQFQWAFYHPTSSKNTSKPSNFSSIILVPFYSLELIAHTHNAQGMPSYECSLNIWGPFTLIP